MAKKHLLTAWTVCLLLASTTLSAQKTFRYGLGGGINFSHINELNSYPLFEDVTGEEYSSTYSSIFSNLGSQFFFHGEWELKAITVVIKPGIYSYKFSKTDEIIFSTEPTEQTNNYLLRYFQIPLEVRRTIGSGTLKPYIGAAITYGHLLQQGTGGTASFIHPKFTAAPLVGAYYSFEQFDLVLDAGYNLGLHAVTREDSRTNTSSSTPYTQSDLKLNDLFVSLSVLFTLSKQNSKGALDCPPPTKRGQKNKKSKRK